MKIAKKIIAFAVAISIAAQFSFIPQQAPIQENLLKAAFLYRFTDYIDWGNSTNSNDFTIAVLGKSGITDPLNEIAQEKKIQGRNIVIKQYDNINDITDCQVVFV